MKPTRIGKILYGMLFCVILPLILIGWAFQLNVSLPVRPEWQPVGIVALVAGLVLIAEAMWQLWKNGGGLPMNAFPPIRYVSSGSYSLFKHPIYTGFCLVCAGLSIVLQSSGGLYIVTPTTVLLCVSLVLGYESHDIKTRFNNIEHSTFFGLPARTNGRLNFKQRFGVMLSAFVPWFFLYELLIQINLNVGHVNTMSAFEHSWPVYQISEIPYAFTYMFIGIIPFILKNQVDARDFLIKAWLITAICIFMQIVLPFYCEPRAFDPDTILGQLIVLERSLDGAAAAFPSFHVMWALLAASMLSLTYRKLTFCWYALASIVSLSCIGTGNHSIADVLSAILVFACVENRRSVIVNIQRVSERLANSWKCWNVGSIRIINHSMYAGFAAFLGIFIVCQATADYTVVLVVTLSSLLCGAIWGQALEGSKIMLRPFGFFGGLFGGILGLVISHLFLSADFVQFDRLTL
jgi:protein-S-isoprenylcysteine O-methyltransferase Ste14